MSFQTARTRTKVICFCKKCKGSLVDPRTKLDHKSRFTVVKNLSDSFNNSVNNAIDSNNQMECDPIVPIADVLLPEIMAERNYIFLTNKSPMLESEKLRKGKISDLVLRNLIPDDESDDDYRGGDSEDDDGRDSDDSDDSGDSDDGDDEEIDFSSTDFSDDDPNLPVINSDYDYIWVILWILQYQQRYMLSDVATDALFKFLRFFLLTIDENKFLSFPSSLFVAKKVVEITAKIIKYAICSSCHKLYDMKEILKKTEISTCSFVNYLNHTMERFQQKCNNPLVKKIDSNVKNQMFRPVMTFSLTNIRQQLTLLFCRKDFEMSCRKWAERKNETHALFDIYDGMIWKEFKDNNDELFFAKEHADTHLGLMINMDWFQPFVSSSYSVGVIYAVICNLPRTERYKSHNILTLAVIPSPKEPKLHEINNYLNPIINQLVRL